MKYLGIVDGTMGILSRKMALQGADKQAKQGSVVGPLDNHAVEPSLRGVQGSPVINPGQALSLQPVLGKKNYTKTIGQNRQRTIDQFSNEILDEINHLTGEVPNFQSHNSRTANPYVSTDRAVIGGQQQHLNLPVPGTGHSKKDPNE